MPGPPDNSDTRKNAADGTGGGGSVTNVFGRTGPVTAQTNDYSVAQVNGAAALNGSVLVNTTISATPAAGDNSLKLADTAYADRAAALATAGAQPTNQAPVNLVLPVMT